MKQSNLEEEYIQSIMEDCLSEETSKRLLKSFRSKIRKETINEIIEELGDEYNLSEYGVKLLTKKLKLYKSQIRKETVEEIRGKILHNITIIEKKPRENKVVILKEVLNILKDIK